MTESRHGLETVASTETDRVERLAEALRRGSPSDAPAPFVASGGKGGDDESIVD